MNTFPTCSSVLLIAPKFFGYEKDIAAELARLGRQVDFLPDRPFDNPLAKAFFRVLPELGGRRACDRFFAHCLEALGKKDYSVILVIQGEGVSISTLTLLRTAYPRAKMVFYTWDSMANKPSAIRNLSFYDRCCTFDPEDAKNYRMTFRPLFYSNGFDRPESVKYDYDLSFVGTVHSDRYRIINTLLQQLPPGARTFIYFYLQAPWVFYFRRIFTNTITGSKRGEFRFSPLSKEATQGAFFSSRVILDIEHVRQRGATMRTMEVIGSKRKMITTNAMLRNYDFYNPRNIDIIDRTAPRLSPDFFSAPYEDIPPVIRQKYSLFQWVTDVCDFLDKGRLLDSK